MKQCIENPMNVHLNFGHKIKINMTNLGKLLDLNKVVVRSRRNIKKRFKISDQ